MSKIIRQCGNKPDAVDKSPTQPTFTPGPWETDGGYSVISRHGLKAPSRHNGGDAVLGTFIAAVETHGAHPRRLYAAPGDSASANAELIAAAPAMLEALTRCIIFLAPHQRSAPEDVYTLVLSAIAKAEGSAA